jgi:hypothetical protein
MIIRGDDGFLPSMAGDSTGAIHSKGTYFAKNARHSDDYACTLPSGKKRVLAAQVVVGLWAQGKK